MAARPIWTGTVSFALLSVPVKLYTATRSKDISFNQIEKSTGGRIKQKRVSATTGEEVAADDIVKGYDLGGERYVVIEPDELEALAPRDAANERTIQILDFVDLADIDPINWAWTNCELRLKAARPFQRLSFGNALHKN